MESISKPPLPIEIYTVCQNRSPEEYRKKSLKNPIPLPTRNGVSKAPYHDLPPEQGDWRALKSKGMITE
jgi:hypothetical protein